MNYYLFLQVKATRRFDAEPLGALWYVRCPRLEEPDQLAEFETHYGARCLGSYATAREAVTAKTQAQRTLDRAWQKTVAACAEKLAGPVSKTARAPQRT